MYAEIDAKIFAAIKTGHSPLYEYHVRQEAERIADLTGRAEFRVIDARLQAMRKAGKIAYRHGLEAGWRIVQP